MRASSLGFRVQTPTIRDHKGSSEGPLGLGFRGFEIRVERVWG